MRLLAVALIAVLGSGCFALEEIDAGQEIMDKHYAGTRKESPEPRDREPAPDANAFERLRARAEDSAERFQRWWANLSLTGGDAHSEDDEQLVRCTLDGRTHFARWADCRARGGTAVPVDPPASGSSS